MKKKKFGIIAIAVLLLAGAFTVLLAAGPVVSTGKNIIALPEEYLQAVESQAKGLYSSKLPLIPVAVTVEETDGSRVFYTIHYFPLGSVGMSYHPVDGYNMEKPLTGI